MCANVGLGGHGDFIADRNVVLQVSARDSPDANRLSRLFDGRIRFNPADNVFNISIRPPPVASGADLAMDFHAAPGCWFDINTPGARGDFEIHGS